MTTDAVTTEAVVEKRKIDILPGSYALLDFDQFQRQAVITGGLNGFIPGKFVLNSDYKS